MRVLSIGTDITALDPSSTLSRRLIEYGSLVEELHIVIYTDKSVSDGRVSISSNVFVYPTVSGARRGFFRDAHRIGSAILKNEKSGHSWLISAQDPFETALAGYRLKRRFGHPLQIQVHTDFLSPHFRNESVKNWYRTFLGKRMIRRADCVRVVSNRVKQSIVREKIVRPNIPITILPIFVDKKYAVAAVPERGSSVFKNSLVGGSAMVLMVSRLTREKNIPLALRAIRSLGDRFRAKLVIVGDGPEKEKLEKLARPLGNKVVFVSWQSNLEPYYSFADVFLNTSNYEGYGRTIVEASLAGLPIVTTDVGCAGEIVLEGESAVILPVGDEKRLAEAIADCLENPDRLATLRAGAIRVSSRIGDKEDYLKTYKACWQECFGVL